MEGIGEQKVLLYKKIVLGLKRIFNPDRLLCAHLVIGTIFIIIAGFCISTGYMPIHDVISWHGVFHFFYSNIERGVLPFWNSYSQTGTPFYTYYQSFGLLEPSNFLFILVQKIIGCTTLTTYIMHYLFYFFIFIIGAYYSLRIITQNNSISLLFSLILLLGCFPMFMRQNGALNSFFLIPLITFFILSFVKESAKDKKGLYFFIASYLFAIALNVYIPAGVIFFLLALLICIFIFRMARINETVKFIKSRSGFFLLSMSVIVVMLISLPTLALYYNFHEDNEIFPSVRIFQKNGNQLAKLYVSDIKEDLFSEKFTNNLKTSNNSWNLFGLIFEPQIHFMGERLSSEIFLYISMLPILCIFFVLKERNKYGYVFLVIAILTLFTMTNFQQKVLAEPNLVQNIIITISPFLKAVEVLQNFGPLFLFCLIIVGAIGFKAIADDNKSKFIFGTSIFIVFFKNMILVASVYLFVMYNRTLFSLGNNLDSLAAVPIIRLPYRERSILTFVLIVAAIVLVMLFCFLISKKFQKIRISEIRRIAIIVLFFDLLLFDLFHATHFLVPDIVSYERIIDNQYYKLLKKENMLTTRHEDAFINYREPFSVPSAVSEYAPSFSTFWGHEVLSSKKIAFPNVLKTYLSEDFVPYWDHFYMTKFYYDYIVNVSPTKQLVTSNVISPILNFFPDKNTIFLNNKYEIIKKINQMNLKQLDNYIFIEKHKDVKLTSASVSDFFYSKKHLKFNEKELLDFKKSLENKYVDNKNINYTIDYYNPNRLLLTIEAPVSGYFYFGDGYSKNWRAYVDNMRSEIYKTNINFKSVYVPKGRHKIDFVYDPVLFRYSLYAYLIGNLMALSIIAIYSGYMVRKRAEL